MALRSPVPKAEGRSFDVVGFGGNAIDHLIVIPGRPEFGEKVKFVRYSLQGGGRTATAMVTVARLGGRARYIGGVGDDEEGGRVLDGLREEGVDVAGVRVRTGEMTQRAFVLVDEVTGERTIVWGRGPGIPFAPEEVDAALVRTGRLFYTDAQDPLSAAVAARAAKQGGQPVVADLEDVRPGCEAFLPMIDVLIAGARFPELATGRGRLAESLPRLEGMTAGALIIVTLGPEGAIAWIDGRVERFPGYIVGPVDTTGAGDVFHGAFVIAHLAGRDVVDALDFSNAAAAMKCRFLGGRDGIPRSVEEVDDFRRTARRRGR